MIFLDTSFFYAFLNADDDRHEDALMLGRKIKQGEFGPPCTSTYIFDELVTLILARQRNHEMAVKAGEYLLGHDIQLFDVLPTAFDNSWGVFKKREGLSFTDCTTIELMKLYRVANLATFDKDFQFIKEVNVIK